MATLEGSPRKLDSLLVYAVDAAKRCAPGPQKRWAFAMGVSKSRASRHLSGDVHSPNASVLFTMWKLATGNGTNSWPLIGESIAVTIQAELEDMSTPELEALLRKLDDMEHNLEADENRHTLNAAVNPSAEQLEAAALANVKEGELSFRRAAVQRILAGRKRSR